MIERTTLNNEIRTEFARNMIVNPEFIYFRRGGTSASVSAGTSTPQFTTLADKFDLYVDPNGGTLPAITYSQLALVPGEVPFARYCYRISTGGTMTSPGANAQDALTHKVENGVRYFCGLNGTIQKYISFAFLARTNIAGKKLGLRVYRDYGTGGSPSTADNIHNTYFTLTANEWNFFTVLINTGSLSGKTFGTNNDDALCFDFRYAWGASLASLSGDSVAEGYRGSLLLDITELQMNPGSYPLKYYPRGDYQDLLLCMREWQESSDFGSGVPWTHSRSDAPSMAPFPVPMRKVPTMAVFNGGGSGTITIDNINRQSFRFQNNTNAARDFFWTADAKL